MGPSGSDEDDADDGTNDDDGDGDDNGGDGNDDAGDGGSDDAGTLVSAAEEAAATAASEVAPPGVVISRNTVTSVRDRDICASAVNLLAFQNVATPWQCPSA